MTPTTTSTRTTSTRTGARRRVPMDPRIRQRRISVTRSAGRRRLRVLVVLLVLSLVVVLAWFALHSALFSAKVLTVTGAHHTTTAQVAAATGLESHPPLLDVNTGQIAQRVDALPWVASATVSRRWPDGVAVHVVERVPVATLARTGGGVAVVDRSGRVLEIDPRAPPGLVRLQTTVVPGAAGSTLGPAVAGLLKVAATLPRSFAAQVTTVVDGGNGDVRLALTTPVSVDLGTATDLGAKYEDVTALLVSATLHDGDVIDVTVPDAPTVTGP